MKKTLGLALLTCLSAVAEPRAEIEKCYRRAALATKLKFVDGAYSIRAPKFQLYSAEGMKLDLGVERGRQEQLLAPAVRVEETIKIVKFEPQTSERVLCTVKYLTNYVYVDPQTDKERTEVMETNCLDEWLETRKGWKILTSRVTRQDVHR